MVIDTWGHTFKREQVIIGYPDIIPFDRGQEMQAGPIFQFFFDLAGIESLWERVFLCIFLDLFIYWYKLTYLNSYQKGDIYYQKHKIDYTTYTDVIFPKTHIRFPTSVSSIQVQ